MSNRAGYPLYAAINITTKCNLDCKYCYLQPRSGLDMSVGDFKKVIDDLKTNAIFFVHLSGGEPFIHPDFNKIVEYACDNIGDVSILTNGTIVREEHLQFLRDLTKKSPVKIQVSIDSVVSSINQQTRNVSSDLVIENIKKLSDTGVLLAAGMVVTKYNVDTLVESILTLSEHMQFFHIMCIQDTEYNPRLEDMMKPDGNKLTELWKKLDKLQEEHGLDISKPSDFELSNYKGCAFGAPCAAAFTYLVIDPDLNVRPCDKINSIILGNMRNRSLKSIWNSEAADQFLDTEIPLCMSKRGKLKSSN